jgi:hypothetical protein
MLIFLAPLVKLQNYGKTGRVKMPRHQILRGQGRSARTILNGRHWQNKIS